MARPESITAVGSTQIDTSQSKFGGSSAFFNGVDGDGGLEMPNFSHFVTGDVFTIEMWYRPVDDQGGFAALYSQNWFDTGSGAELVLFANSGAGVTTTADGQNNYNNFGTGAPNTFNTWHHIALTSDGTGNSKLYINGNEEASTTDLQIYDGNDKPVTLGVDTFGNSVFDGWLDEIRISSVVRYTSNFTPPSDEFVNDDDTLLLLHCNGTDGSTTFEDDVSQVDATRLPVSVTVGGDAQISTSQSKFGGSSLYLDGAGDYLVLNGYDSSATDSEFTIETWVYFPVLPSQMSAGAAMWWRTATPYCFASFSDDPANGFGVEAGGERHRWDFTPTTNTWYHVALTRDSSNNLHAYVDGVEQTRFAGSGVYSGSFFGGDPINIGVFNTSGYMSEAEGYFDEFRLSSVNRYPSAFNKPTDQFYNDYDTTWLFHFDDVNGSTTFDDDASLPVPQAINLSVINITPTTARLDWDQS